VTGQARAGIKSCDKGQFLYPKDRAVRWCDRGYIFYVLEGELVSELHDGRKSVMTTGTSYHVSDLGDPAHRSYSKYGAKMFVVD